MINGTNIGWQLGSAKKCGGPRRRYGSGKVPNAMLLKNPAVMRELAKFILLLPFQVLHRTE
jgi:hypothetical protein